MSARQYARAQDEKRYLNRKAALEQQLASIDPGKSHSFVAARIYVTRHVRIVGGEHVNEYEVGGAGTQARRMTLDEAVACLLTAEYHGGRR